MSRDTTLTADDVRWLHANRADIHFRYYADRTRPRSVIVRVPGRFWVGRRTLDDAVASAREYAEQLAQESSDD